MMIRNNSQHIAYNNNNNNIASQSKKSKKLPEMEDPILEPPSEC